MTPPNQAAFDALIFLGGLALVIIGGLIVWFSARLLRWKWPRLSLPWSLTTAHTALLTLCVALAPTGIFFIDRPFDDLYLAFYFFPGVHLYIVEGWILGPFQPLFLRLPEFWGAVLYLLIAPALILIVLGGVQWYLIGKVAEKIRAIRARRKQFADAN